VCGGICDLQAFLAIFMQVILNLESHSFKIRLYELNSNLEDKIMVPVQYQTHSKCSLKAYLSRTLGIGRVCIF
jgi:hypothetical protein